VHRDRVEHLLDWRSAADLARLRRRIVKALKQLENVSVRTTVLVDWHRAERLYQASE
jgi:hypothetical protein